MLKVLTKLKYKRLKNCLRIWKGFIDFRQLRSSWLACESQKDTRRTLMNQSNLPYLTFFVSGHSATTVKFWTLFIQITATVVSSFQEILVKWCSTYLMLGGEGNLWWFIFLWEPINKVQANDEPNINFRITWWTDISIPECKSRIGCSSFRVMDNLL